MTVQLTGIGFNGVDLTPPAGVSNYETTVTVSTDPTHPVQVDAVFDPATGVLTWTMTSTDPLTGQLSLDPLAGFLPPDNAQGQGEGFVTYTAKPIAALATGATITNQASVVFDTNAPIDTPTTINTLDATPPVTTASPSGTAGANGWYTGSVQAALLVIDAGSGVAATWYAVDGGTPQTYDGSPFTVTGDGTHTVTFYSIDNVGNQEPNETETLKIDTAPPVTTASLSGTAGTNGWYTGSVQVRSRRPTPARAWPPPGTRLTAERSRPTTAARSP